MSEVGDVGQIRALQVRSLKDGVFHVGHPEIGVAEVRASKIGFHQIGYAETGTFQIGVLEIRAVKVGLLQNRIADAQPSAFFAFRDDPLVMQCKHFF